MTRPRSPGLLRSDEPLADRYDVALLDLDGVVYLGPQAIAGVPEALATVRARGMRLAFVTNNAARPPESVAAHLSELGIPAGAADVTTSAQAAAHYLAERLPAGAHVLVVGTLGLTQALEDRRLVPVQRDADDVAAVVQGFSPELTWQQLAQGALAINRGVPWVATNLDPSVPSPLGRLPGNGSMVAALRHATGVEPVATGKPDPTMHRESVERSRARRPLVVGDRLDTDIEGANAAGCPSLLVFSGVTDPAQLMTAPPALRPGYLAADVASLLDAHPAPVQTDHVITCGDWEVRIDDSAGSGLTLSSSRSAQNADRLYSPTRRLDALRALCVAAWRGAGRPELVGADDAATAALEHFGLR